MTRDEFNQKLKKSFPSCNLEKPLREQMTSVDLANLVVVLEKEYQIEILPTELTTENFETVESLFDLIKNKVG